MDLESFEIQDSLCPIIFSEKKRMLKTVRENLLAIAEEYYKYLDTDWVEMEDVILTGSLANYNWSKYSDVDLHVVIDFEKVDDNKDFVTNFMQTKKTLWNDKHDIKINLFEVELYSQDVEDDLVAGGVYSVKYDKWLVKPKKMDVDLNEDMIEKMFGYFNTKISDILARFSRGDYDGLTADITSLKDKLYGMRKKSLKSGGEFSSGNIAFKALRRGGLLDSLFEIEESLVDDKFSMGNNSVKSVNKNNRLQQDSGKKKKVGDNDKQAMGKYYIQGRRFNSLRQAEKVLGVPKSTIEYRLKSDNSEFSDYREINQ